MTNEQIQKLELSILNLKEKKSRVYFMVQDTKGNAKASVKYIYQMAMSLKKNGFNPIMLHEKPEYHGVSDWMGEEYMLLEHRPIEGTNLEISPDDLIVVPELYGFVMDQITKLPCGKIVLSQCYDYIFENLEGAMRSVSFDVIQPTVSDLFVKSEYPAKTIINIHTRDHRDTINLIKHFYAKFPQYRWITFRDLRGLTETQFAEAMKESFVTVWIDQQSSYGTFPLESMKMGIPVIGLVPDVVPSWMSENNGIWINNKTIITDVISDFIQNWLEDNINPQLLEEMENTVKTLPSLEDFESEVVSIFSKFFETRLENFVIQLDKFQTIEE
jgi:hypothetical protein